MEKFTHVLQDGCRIEVEKGQLVSAIDALFDMGDPDSQEVLSLISRLLADDWTGTGLYQKIDRALSEVEQAVDNV